MDITCFAALLWHNLSMKMTISRELSKRFHTHEACITIPFVQHLFDVGLLAIRKRLISFVSLFVNCPNLDLLVGDFLDAKAFFHAWGVKKLVKLFRVPNVCPIYVLSHLGTVLHLLLTSLLSKKTCDSLVQVVDCLLFEVLLVRIFKLFLEDLVKIIVIVDCP